LKHRGKGVSVPPGVKNVPPYQNNLAAGIKNHPTAKMQISGLPLILKNRGRKKLAQIRRTLEVRKPVKRVHPGLRPTQVVLMLMLTTARKT